MWRNLLFALLTLLTAALGPARAREITLLAGRWPPYVEESLPGQGLALSIVREAFRRGGHTVKFDIKPWSRSLEGTLLGVYEGLAAAWHSQQRARELAYSAPYLVNEIRFAALAERPLKVDSLRDLTGMRVGVVRDYAYGEPLDSADYVVKVPANHLLQNLLRLVNRQIDMTLDDTRAIRWQLDNFLVHSKQRIVLLDPPYRTRKLFVAMHRSVPDHKRVLSDFNRGLTAMRKDGTYQQILEQFDAH
ncbi:MAG TPA: transporter substrate-binding domain-containing protein [Chromatiales bacterium]|nr:transporter substrate-binding domain-containing protein [Chromatiales bacterium]